MTKQDTGIRNCLKLRTIDGIDFVFTPSLTFVEALGYIKQNKVENTGRSYSRESNGFVLFRRDSLGSQQELASFWQGNPEGQAERFCADFSRYGI